VFEGIAPSSAVYVSCNPDVLAVELPAIMNLGYRVERVHAVDMFPHTDHIEAVVTLIKAK
jgi:23S rRNA (uracil1939-C5)-methyltransferase